MAVPCRHGVAIVRESAHPARIRDSCLNYWTGKPRSFWALRISGALLTPSRRRFGREGAKVILTYQGERLKQTVEELGAELGAARIFECDVTNGADLARLAELGGWTQWCTASPSPIARI